MTTASGRSKRLIAAHRLLQLKVDVLGHPGDLHAALELHLPPLTAGVGLAQRLDQGAGLGAQVAEADLHLTEQGLHRPIGAAPILAKA